MPQLGMKILGKAEKPQRTLKVLTREDGVRDENPLLKTESGYFINSTKRTPELRSTADDLLKASKALKK